MKNGQIMQRVVYRKMFELDQTEQLVADATCVLQMKVPNVKANGRVYLFSSTLCFKMDEKNRKT